MLFLQSGGILLFYRIELHLQQQKIKQMLVYKNLNLELLTLSKDIYARDKKSGNEISIDGRMYDIKSRTFEGNTVKLLLFHDKKEELIIRTIRKVMHSNNQRDNGLLNRIVKLLSLNYTFPSILHNSFTTHQVQKHIHLFFNEIIQSRVADILTPPPEVA
jgi:hypothetical protein